MKSEAARPPALVRLAATDPSTGRFRAVEEAVQPGQALDHFDALTDDLGGYLEVRLHDDDYPVITVSTLHGHCAIHWFSGEQEVALLDGDGSLDGSATVELPIFEERAAFTGEHVVSRDRARVVLDEFLVQPSARPTVGWTVL
jgi:hypothetical protein